MKMLKNTRVWLSITVGIIVIAGVLALVAKPSPAEITHAQFAQRLEAGTMVEIGLIPTPYSGIYAVRGKWAETTGAEPQRFMITTHLDDAILARLAAMDKARINLPGKGSQGMWVNVISSLLILALIVGVVGYQMHLGKGKGTQKLRERPAIRFKDVAGIEEAKQEVSEVVDFLRDPQKYRKLGGTLPKGVLLVGPPGTGKTMLAKAIAGEAEANFFSVHGSDFNEVYVGVGAKRVRELFRQAERHKPAIIFIDEIDCLGKNRKHDTNGELQQTNNALLAAMDGFESSEGIVVIAATNRPEDMDEALLRPGRFDRKVHVPYPDRAGRRAILAVHAEGKPIDDAEAALERIAQTTPAMSGADLASLMNEAAILCARNNAPSITLAELEESRDKIRYGKERRSMILKNGERELVAYHEAGHTIINLKKNLLPPLYKVSIIPRGGALGVTTLLPDEDQNIHCKDFLLQQMVVLMGGRAAEKTFYGRTTNGANGDLDAAKNVARKMIHDWGMGDRLYYDVNRPDAEREINRLLEQADREALAIIEAERENTRKLAEALLARETLTRQEVVELLAGDSQYAAPAGA